VKKKWPKEEEQLHLQEEVAQQKEEDNLKF